MNLRVVNRTAVVVSQPNAAVSEDLLITRPSGSAKSLVDGTIALVLILLLSPAFLVIALMIKATSRGPVFFVQDRIGRGGQLFPLVKFRTMVNGAHLQRDEVLGCPDEEMPDRYRGDPRITSVGRFLRRWSMDELPQLMNVGMGQMAIVGPRPILEEEKALLEPQHHERHRAKPGLTGLWQVNGRKETTWEKRMELDLEYVRTMSAQRDLVIIARTAKVVLKGDGSY